MEPVFGCRGLDAGMGRYSKGERRQFMTRIPPAAGDALVAEVKESGGSYSDFVAYVLCEHAGMLVERPTNRRARYPDLRPAPGGRVELATRVPIDVADALVADADRMGCSYADYIAQVLCARYKVPFAPRVKKKALKTWAAQGHAFEAVLRPTG